MKILPRKVKRADLKGDSIMVYKFDNEQTLQEYLDDFDLHFRKSIKVLHSGRFDKVAEDYLKMVEDDNIWHDLKLQKGDMFCITKENVNFKSYEEDRKEKKLKKQNTPKEIEAPVAVVKEVKTLTQEEVKLLYSGTIHEVVDKLNASGLKHNGKEFTYAIIYNKRKTYEEQNPDFIVPDIAKGKLRKEPQPIVKKTIKDFNESQITYLLNNPIADVKRNLSLTVFQIRDLRIEYCKLNPDFVVPRISGFDPTGVVNNKLQEKPEKPAKVNPNLFTQEEIALIWDGSGKEVADTLGRTYQSVYHNRVAYCKQHPDFVIPAAANFTPPFDVVNKVEVVEPVVKERKKRKTEIAEVSDIPVVAEPVSIPETQTEVASSTELETILQAFGKLGQKPKAITLSSGIKIEF